MILRRLAQSIRKQDWFAVTIEFVIVVAGIFVGLQVTEWNEQRQLRERELNYLIRLAEDVGAMRTEIAEIQARAEGRPENALRAFRALEACDAALAEADDFRLTFAFYQNQRTAVLVERTYDEMVASGALAAMADRRLSSAIASTFSELRNYKDFVTATRVSLPILGLAGRNYARGRSARWIRGSPGRSPCRARSFGSIVRLAGRCRKIFGIDIEEKDLADMRQDLAHSPADFVDLGCPGSGCFGAYRLRILVEEARYLAGKRIERFQPAFNAFYALPLFSPSIRLFR